MLKYGYSDNNTSINANTNQRNNSTIIQLDDLLLNQSEEGGEGGRNKKQEKFSDGKGVIDRNDPLLDFNNLHQPYIYSEK